MSENVPKPIRCLITAGPTREFFDPVRYISNPSSGKMGYRLAEAAVARGWRVQLVSGPVCLPTPDRVLAYPVVTGQEMFERVAELFEQCDLLIMTAAVCDFRPLQRSEQKVKKRDASWQVDFEPVVDILKAMSERRTHQKLVGFAAETEHVEEYARRKLEEKGLDWIAANRVGGPDGAFESDNNQILLIPREGGALTIGPATKAVVAERMIERIAEHLEVAI